MPSLPPLSSITPVGLQASAYTTAPPAGACGHLPHLHPLLIAPSGQKLSIRTPRHAIEDGVDVVRVPQELHTGSRARVPQPDGTVPPATGQEPTIRTPCHPIDAPAMAAQYPERRPVGYRPDGHQPIRARAGELRASGTPGHIVERDRIARHDLHTLPTLHVPHP